MAGRRLRLPGLCAVSPTGRGLQVSVLPSRRKRRRWWCPGPGPPFCHIFGKGETPGSSRLALASKNQTPHDGFIRWRRPSVVPLANPSRPPSPPLLHLQADRRAGRRESKTTGSKPCRRTEDAVNCRGGRHVLNDDPGCLHWKAATRLRPPVSFLVQRLTGCPRWRACVAWSTATGPRILVD